MKHGNVPITFLPREIAEPMRERAVRFWKALELNQRSKHGKRKTKRNS